MSILIFGNGFIGSRLARAWPDAQTTHARIDDHAQVAEVLDRLRPDAVVNAAGVTGKPNIAWCETNQTEACRGNVIGPILLSHACRERGMYLAHLGSCYVFSGPSPDPNGWREDDAANPIDYYSRTKYTADLLLGRSPDTAVVRLQLPIDSEPSPKNLIDKLIGYKQIVDVRNSVTFLEDFIIALRTLIEKKGTGIFHLTNPGGIRYRDLIGFYQKLVDADHACAWIDERELASRGMAAQRLSSCLIQSTRTAELGIRMRPAEEALRHTMEKYAAAVRKLSTGDDPMPASDSPKPYHFLRQHRREMKGVVLAGGKGTRLAPLTNITNKHLLPIVNREMVLYPLQTLLDAGVRSIMLVTGPDFSGQFMNLLGSGVSRGCQITYRIQDEAGGIAHALGMAESFVSDNHCTAILGDNLFEDNFLPFVTSFQSGAMLFYKSVSDPHRFGVVELDTDGRVLSIEEKPAHPKSALAQTGLYVYEPSVFDVIRQLKPSGRGELEITDVNNHFLREGRLAARPVKGFWSDAGTYPSMRRAMEYFAKKEGIEVET